MAWLELSGQGLLTGENSTALERFFTVYAALAEQPGSSQQAVLEAMAEGTHALLQALPDEVRGVIGRVARVLLHQGVTSRLQTMFATLAELVEGSAGPVVLDWPHGEWRAPAPPVEAIPIGLSLSASADIGYVLAPDLGRTPPPGSLLTQLSFGGEVAFDAKLAVPIGTLGGLSAAGAFGARRRLTYGFAYPRDLTTWRAVADSFARVRRIDSFDAVARSFQRPAPGPIAPVAPALQEIVMTGEEALRLRTGATLRIPLASEGTLTGRASGEIKLGNAFRLRITRPPADSGVSALRLRVEASAERQTQAGGEVGIGYAFGIGDLGPATARTLIASAVKADRVLAAIDRGLGEGASFLQPGSLLRGLLVERLRERIDDSGAASLRLLLGDVLGLDAEGDRRLLAGRAADLIATLMDNAQGLFGTDLTDSIATLLAPIAENAVGTVKAELVSLSGAIAAALSDRLNQAAARLDQTLHQALAALLGKPPTSALADLKLFLDQARATLGEITEGLQASNLDLIAGEVALSMSRSEASLASFSADITAAGKDFYKSVIWRPGSGASLLIDSQVAPDQHPLPGVTPLLANDLETSRRLRGIAWNVGLIDTPARALGGASMGGAARSFAEVRVERTLSGVSVGQESWVKVTRGLTLPFFGESFGRAVELSDMLSFVGTEASATPTGRLQLSYTWAEANFSDDDLERFTSCFERCHLLGEEGSKQLARLHAEAKEATADPKPEASLRAFLVVPPDSAFAVIRFGVEAPQRVRAIIKEVFTRSPLDEIAVDDEQVNAVQDYLGALRAAVRKMMRLKPEATEEERNALREELADAQQEAQSDLRQEGWLDTTDLGFIRGYPGKSLLAFFVCFAEIASEATSTQGNPAGIRPGVVFAFTPAGGRTRYVISPNAGVKKSSDARLDALRKANDARIPSW